MTIGQFLAGFFFAVVGVALGALCVGEAIAVWLGTDATISQIIAGQLTDHPRMGVVWAFIAGAVIMLLLVHFADVFKLWQP